MGSKWSISRGQGVGGVEGLNLKQELSLYQGRTRRPLVDIPFQQGYTLRPHCIYKRKKEILKPIDILISENSSQPLNIMIKLIHSLHLKLFIQF